MPDPFVLSWLPFAVRTARRLLRQRRFDCVVTCSGPHSTQLLGLLLPRDRPAWIADFEEGWRFEPLRGRWPTRLQDAVDERLEACVLGSADCVTSVSQPILSDAYDRFDVPVSLVRMAWDPNSEAGVRLPCPIELNSRRVNIVYTGGFNHVPERRDPSTFVLALRRFANAFPREAAQLSVVIAGVVSPEERARLSTAGNDDLVQCLGVRSKAEAVALQRNADALLLIATGSHTSTVTGKLHEYLAVDRPIIALASDNEAARVIRSTRTGVVVAPDDVDGLVQVLRDCVNGRLADALCPSDLADYRYPAPAHAFVDAIGVAIAARKAR